MIKADDKNFNEIIDKKGLILVDFYATWCMPCSMQAEVLDKIETSREKEFDIVKVNVDEAPELSQKFEISSIPTLVFIKEGKIVDKIVGFCDEDEVLRKASELA